MATQEQTPFKDQQRIPTHTLRQGTWQRDMAESCGWRFYGVYDETAAYEAYEKISARVTEVEAEKRAEAQRAASYIAVAQCIGVEHESLAAA